MKNGISKLILIVAIVLAGVVVMDLSIGFAMDRLLPKIGNSGDTGRTYCSMYKVDDPVLIIGSSRANHHYVPQIISDSLGLPVRNIGRDGCFFSYNCCVINSILDRYTPELIIWENGGDYLSENCEDPLENMYPYYLSNPKVNNCINSYIDVLDRIPLYSSFYRYNSIIHRILIRYFIKSSDEGNDLNGYLPLKPKKWQPKTSKKSSVVRPSKISEVKTQQFASVLKRCKEEGVKLVIVDSPRFTGALADRTSVERMETICDLLDVPFFDNTDLEGYTGNIEMFNDNIHMNEIGAEKYTIRFVQQMDSLFTSNK